MKLAGKLSLFFTLLTVVPILVVGWLSYRNSRTIIEQQTINHLISTNIYKEAEFERWVRDNVRTLEILANRPYFKNDLADKLDGDEIFNPIHTTELGGIEADLLLPVVKGSGFFELFILQRGSGRLLASTDERQKGKYLDDQLFFKHGSERTFIQNVYYSMALQQPVMTISTPIKDSRGKLTAVLAGHLDLSELSEIMGKRSGLSQTEDTYLVNKFNFFITEPGFGRDYALKKSVHTEGVLAALAHKNGVGFYNDYRTVPVIGAYHWMPDREMAILTEIDQAEAFAPISALEKKIIGIGLAVALLAVLAGAFIARMITRPVSRLVEGTEEISRGNLDFKVETSGGDEIGDLSRAFSRMTKRLKATLVSRDELLREVVERKRAQESLKKTMVDLERSNRELEQFAYVASHDLQEPLRMVSSYTQLLAERYEGQLDEKAKRYIDYAVDGAIRMQHLINDLLTYSRVRTRGGAIEVVDACSALGAAIVNLEAMIRESGALVTNDDLPLVTADSVQLAQVLQNLIGNAIKFRGESSPFIHISAKAEDHSWLFSVRDNGIGIDPKYQEKIFVIFQRLHTQREYPGTGIGLALCKRIIERHGGRIWCDSEPGKGAVFHFTLPDGKKGDSRNEE